MITAIVLPTLQTLVKNLLIILRRKLQITSLISLFINGPSDPVFMSMSMAFTSLTIAVAVVKLRASVMELVMAVVPTLI